MNNRGARILGLTLVLLSVGVSGCGGGGDKGSTITIAAGNSGWVSIGDTSSPMPDNVDSSPIALTGQSFISPSVSWYDETHGVSGVEVTWRNDTTGTSGSAYTYVECGWFIIPFCVNMWDTTVPLMVGENRITIAAGDTDGNSGSASITVTYVPGALKHVIAVPGDGQVTLGWPNVDGAQYYNVYWSTQQGGEAWGSKVPSSTNQFVHSGLSNCTACYYVVTTVSSFGESIGSLEASATPVPIPSGLTADAGDRKVSLSWNSDVANYAYTISWSLSPGAAKSTGTGYPGSRARMFIPG